MAKQPITYTQTGKNVEVKLTNVILAFADDVWEPSEQTSDDGTKLGKFGVSTAILIDKVSDWGQEQIKGLKAAMKMARDAEWGDNPPSIAPNCYAMQDGEPVDEMSGERKERWGGFAGKMYINAKRGLKASTLADAIQELKVKHPVQILGPRKTAKDDRGNPCFPTLTQSEDLIYSGAVCDVIIQIYPYNGTGKAANGKNHPNRINASLECIKFVEHGTRLGGGKRVDAQSAFDEEQDDEEVGTGAGGSVAPKSAVDDDPLG